MVRPFSLLSAALLTLSLLPLSPAQNKAEILSRAAESARTGRPGPALELVDKGLEEFPGDKDLLLLRGNLLFRLGRYEESLAAFRSAVRAGGKGPAWEGEAVAALAAGKPGDSLPAAARALAAGRRSLPLLLAGGRAALLLGRPLEGETWFKEALLLYPAEESPRVLLARALLEQGRPKEAAQVSREGLEVLGPVEGILRVLAAADLDLGREGEAADLLEFLAWTGKAGSRDLAALGDLKLRLGLPRQALALYEKAFRGRPPEREQLHREALALWSAGKLAAAEKRLLSRGEEIPAPWWVEIGRLRLARKDTRGAIRAFRKALSRDPESSRALLWLGKTALAEGNPDQAEKAFRLLLSREAEPKEALLGLSEVWEKRGDPREALAVLRRARGEFPSDPEVLERILRLERSMESGRTQRGRTP